MKSNFKLSFLIALFSFVLLVGCGSKTPIDSFSVTAVTNKDYRIESKSLTEIKNPTITLKRGETYEFVVNTYGHPFYIKTEKTTGKTETYDKGVTNNGTNEGIILFTVPKDAPDLLYYVCKYHDMMSGELKIIN